MLTIANHTMSPTDKRSVPSVPVMLRYMKVVAAVVTLVCLSLIVVQLNPNYKQTIVITQPNPNTQSPHTNRHLSTSSEEPVLSKESATGGAVAGEAAAKEPPVKAVSEAVSDSKRKVPRLLCLVTTSPKNHKTKAMAVSETWGKKCDRLLFVSSRYESGLPIILAACEKEDHDHLWCKNRKGIIEAHKLFDGQYDWFLKADDDTYVVVENLKHLVSTHDPNEPIWFGCPFKYPGSHHIKYHSGGQSTTVCLRSQIS